MELQSQTKTRCVNGVGRVTRPYVEKIKDKEEETAAKVK